jgi:hypothetical protein
MFRSVSKLCPPVALLLVLGATQAPAQGTVELRIRLEGADGQPVAGALVALVSDPDQVVAEGLSSDEGRRVLRAPAGTYRVRVRRIGFYPYLSPLVVAPRQSELVLRLDSRPVALSSIVVAARARCRPIGQAETVAMVWEEVSKALRASQLTNDDLAGIGRAQTWRREVSLGGAVLSSDTGSFTLRNRRPFGAISPAALAERGYVRGDGASGWEYFGPDETVLLSREFAATHCFDIVRDRARSGQIGLAFEPVARRRVPDIAGVLWLDENTAELREIVFRYVNAGLPGSFNPGGFTRFARMPSGAWIVSEWQLRFPRLRLRPGAFALPTLAGWIENGGGIIAADDGRRAEGALM